MDVSCFLVFRTRRVAMPLLFAIATVALVTYAAVGLALGFGS
jgi:hypothetical protein